jgi:ribosomal-protein-alanine N-acetyltransferase
MKQPIVILQTSRLILRTTIEADIRHLQQRMFIDREVMRYALGGSPMADADASTEDVVGFAGLSPCDSLGAADFEIGFVLARHVWGKGLATEIGEAQLRFGFDQLGCVRLLGLVDPKNAISIRALKKSSE